MRHKLLFAVIHVSFMASSSAAASPIATQYDAPEECPAEPEFLEDLMSRVDAIRRPDSGDSPWRIHVTLRASEDEFTGEITVEAGDGTATTRRVDGPHCNEVVSALALIAAVTIEATVEARAAERASMVPIAPSPTRPEVDRPARSPAADQRRAINRDWTTGARFLSMGAVAPAMLQGGAMYVGYEPPRSGFDTRLRLSMAWFPSRRFEVDGSPAEVGWSGLRLEGCPVRLGLSDAAILAPCVTAGLGQLRAKGDFEAGRVSASTWVDVGVGGELELPVYGNLTVGLQAAAIAPLTRDKLVFDGPSAVVHEPPRVGVFLAAGIAMRFP